MLSTQRTTGIAEATDGSSAAVLDVAIVAIAAVASLVTWDLWTQVAGVDLAARSGADVREVSAGAVLVTALVVAVAGVLLARLLVRVVEAGLVWWTVLAGAALLFSMVGPLEATGLAAGVGLASLHLVVGAVVLFGVRRVHGPEKA